MEPKRDLVGYANQPPSGRWPNGARLAVSIVVNYEEGSERSHAMGDPDQETMTEWGNYPMPPEVRNLAMESMYEYGSRIGIWRLLDIFGQTGVTTTFYACAVAFEHNPAVAKAAVAADHEICSHGYRWEEVFRLTEEEEREHMRLAIESFKKTCGRRPLGWYCRYGPSVRTRRLVVEEGGFLYDCDAYNDDVPYFVDVSGKRHLVIPYTPDINDFCFWNSPGFVQADDFFRYLKESFETLYAESAKGPRIMSIGLHPRIIGRAGRVRGLRSFIDYARQFPDVWFTTREQIARAWLQRTDANKT
jgi:peptidoglycan/xylan/chitin deacetylase (PgdA/CDA1 family)